MIAERNVHQPRSAVELASAGATRRVGTRADVGIRAGANHARSGSVRAGDAAEPSSGTCPRARNAAAR